MISFGLLLYREGVCIKKKGHGKVIVNDSVKCIFSDTVPFYLYAYLNRLMFSFTLYPPLTVNL